MTGIFEHLKWESLKKRRRDSRLILLYKGLKGKSSIPTDTDTENRYDTENLFHVVYVKHNTT